MAKNRAERWSTFGYRAFVAASILVPLACRSKRGTVSALRTVETLGAVWLVSELLKRTVDARRPDSLKQDSFPSGHSCHSVAVATLAHRLYPRQSSLWTAGAALISLSRIAFRRHRTRDVIAGTVMGYGIARFELSRRRGLLLPWLARSVARGLDKPRENVTPEREMGESHEDVLAGSTR